MTTIRTMLVDDQPDIRQLMRMVIERADQGLEVGCEASGGAEALASLDECDPHVVVLDQMMPGMSGLETAAAIRARRPHQPLVVCSAFLDARVRREASALGIRTCLGKEELDRLPCALWDATNAGGDGTSLQS